MHLWSNSARVFQSRGDLKGRTSGPLCQGSLLITLPGAGGGAEEALSSVGCMWSERCFFSSEWWSCLAGPELSHSLSHSRSALPSSAGTQQTLMGCIIYPLDARPNHQPPPSKTAHERWPPSLILIEENEGNVTVCSQESKPNSQ